MAEDQDKQLPPEAAKNAMPAGMVGFAIPVPVPVFTPQVMPMRMVAPFWPANGMSFMQQYMEVMNAGMAQKSMKQFFVCFIRNPFDVTVAQKIK